MLGFLFIDDIDRVGRRIAYVYAKGYNVAPCGYRHFDQTNLTSESTTWEEFERELDRLQIELDEIRKEAQLRFARATAERYTTTLNCIRLIKC